MSIEPHSTSPNSTRDSADQESGGAAHKVYIDGHAGTTGLRIRDWLAARRDIEILTLPDRTRKDPAARRDMIAAAEVAVLCLPDDASREAVSWAEETGARILDTSTAHRVADGWVFGLPELQPNQREAIASAPRVSNTGCYAASFILLMRPLVESGQISSSASYGIHAVSGYSGGGRQMIERWEDPNGGLIGLPFEAPYALDKVHKHIPEMIAHTGLQQPPHFAPAVGPYRCGMRVQVSLQRDQLSAGADGKTLWELLHERYRDEPFIETLPFADLADSNEHSFDPRRCNDTNRIELRVLPHPSGHVLLMAILDNLGKGAAGNTIQCLNLMLGAEETTGLPR